MRIAFCGNLLNGYCISVFHGVKQWVAEHPDAQILDWDGRNGIEPESLSFIRPDVILLGWFDLSSIPQEYRKLPIIGFSHRTNQTEVPLVGNDENETGRMAAKALIDAGYKQFFALENTIPVVAARLRGFLEVMQQEGQTVINHPSELPPPQPHQCFADVIDDHHRNYRQFLRELPPHSGLFCPISAQIPRLLSLLKDSQSQSIPDSLGLILSDLPAPGMESADLAHVLLDGRRVGWLACELLHDAWRTGRKIPNTRIQVPPLGIDRGLTLRASSCYILLESITNYCSSRLSERLTVDEIARALGLSRRSLEFKLRMGGLPSPYEHLTNLRVRQGEKLLRETDLSIERVAELCGFSEIRSFTRRFRERYGCPPSRFRRNR